MVPEKYLSRSRIHHVTGVWSGSCAKKTIGGNYTKNADVIQTVQHIGKASILKVTRDK